MVKDPKLQEFFKRTNAKIRTAKATEPKVK